MANAKVIIRHKTETALMGLIISILYDLFKSVIPIDLLNKHNYFYKGCDYIGLNVGYLTSDREDNSLFTPYYAVDHIIKYLPRDKRIWTPFDEEWSAFYQRLKEKGFNVIRSSLGDGKDFF